MSSIEKAVSIVGGQTKMARCFGIRQSLVSHWVHRHGQAPAKYIQQISALTNNEVTVDQLLADHEQNHQANKSIKKGMQQ
jgi:DNA-binding transcriptional regulator YdaS (Cro superfamily)